MLPIVRWGNVGVGLVLGALILLTHASARLVAPWISDALNNPQDTFYYAQYFVFGAAVAVSSLGGNAVSRDCPAFDWIFQAARV
jgi:hypothetical protein